MDVQKIVARHCAERGVSFSPSDELFVIGAMIEAAVAEAIPSRAEFAAMVRGAMADGVAAEASSSPPASGGSPSADVRVIVREVLAEREQQDASRWPEGDGPSALHPKPGVWLPAPRPTKVEYVQPSWRESLQMAGAWLRLCRMPEPRERKG